MANPIRKDELINDDALEALKTMSKLLQDDANALIALMNATGDYSGSIKSMIQQQQQDNAALQTYAERIENLENALAKMQKMMAENKATQAALNAEKRKYAKLTDEEAQRVRGLSDNIEKYIKLTNSQVASLKGLASVYAKTTVEIDVQNKSYNELYQTYNAIKDALNKMTVAERTGTEAGKALTAQSLKIRDTLNELQKSTGNYTLQVGKYRAAFDGLGYSFQQILREAPSALNLNQFFLAISNNVPMFLDQLKAFKDEQAEIKANLAQMTEGTKEYAEQLGKVMTVGQKLAKTLLSWQTLVLVGLMIIRNWDKIVNLFNKLFKKIEDGYNSLVRMRQVINEIDASVESSISKTVVELGELNNRLADVTKGSKEWMDITERIKEIIGESYDIADKMPGQIKNITDAYIQQAEQLAKNKFVIEKIAENADNAFKRQQVIEAIVKNGDVESAAKRLGFEKGSDQYKRLEQAARTAMPLPSQTDPNEQIWEIVNGIPKRKGYDKFMTGIMNVFLDEELGRLFSNKELEDLWKKYYKPLVRGNNNNGAKEKQFDFSPSDVDDEYWKAEQARIRMMEKGYDMEIDLQRVKHQEMLEQNDVWQGKREEQLMDNLMGELTLLTNGNEKAAEQMFNAIVKNDTEAVQQMSAGAQQLATKFWSDIEEGQRQHDLIMQGLILDNNEAIKAINMKYDKERMKQIEEQSNSELHAVRRRVKTALQEQQRNDMLVHNIEVLIEAQHRLMTENYKEADSYKEAAKEAEELRKQIEKLQNQVDHSKRLSTKFSLSEVIKSFVLDNTSQGTARKSAEQILGKDAYKAYDVRIQAANKAAEYAKEQYGVESEEYKKAAAEVKAANDALSNAISSDWETIVANTVSGIQEWGNQMLSLYQEMIQAEIDLANAKVEAAKKSTEAAQEEYDKEKALLEAGYASRVEATWAEYQEKKAAQEQAEKDAKAAAQRAKDLETAQQAINMVGASIDTYKAFAGIPVVGPALGIAAVAAMWTLFINAKAKAAQVSQYGEGGFEVLEGGSHASGHDIDLGVNNRRGRRMHAEGKEGIGIFRIAAMQHYGADAIENVVNGINHLEYEQSVGRTLSLQRDMGLHNTMILPRTNLHKVESSLDKLVSYGSSNRYYDPDGTEVITTASGTTRIRRR